MAIARIHFKGDWIMVVIREYTKSIAKMIMKGYFLKFKGSYRDKRVMIKCNMLRTEKAVVISFYMRGYCNIYELCGDNWSLNEDVGILKKEDDIYSFKKGLYVILNQCKRGNYDVG